MQEVWNLEPAKIARLVRQFRFDKAMSRVDFYSRCGIGKNTLRKIESCRGARDTTLAKINKTFPGIFTGGTHDN